MTAVDIDLRVEDDMSQAVFVFDAQLPNAEQSVARRLAGQVALDRLYGFTGEY